MAELHPQQLDALLLGPLHGLGHPRLGLLIRGEARGDALLERRALLGRGGEVGAREVGLPLGLPEGLGELRRRLGHRVAVRHLEALLEAQAAALGADGRLRALQLLPQRTRSPRRRRRPLVPHVRRDREAADGDEGEDALEDAVDDEEAGVGHRDAEHAHEPATVGGQPSRLGRDQGHKHGGRARRGRAWGGRRRQPPRRRQHLVFLVLDILERCWRRRRRRGRDECRRCEARRRAACARQDIAIVIDDGNRRERLPSSYYQRRRGDGRWHRQWYVRWRSMNHRVRRRPRRARRPGRQ